jgi:hypothetical protein
LGCHWLRNPYVAEIWALLSSLRVLRSRYNGNLTLLPAKLRSAGYLTHGLGKVSSPPFLPRPTSAAD